MLHLFIWYSPTSHLQSFLTLFTLIFVGCPVTMTFRPLNPQTHLCKVCLSLKPPSRHSIFIYIAIAIVSLKRTIRCHRSRWLRVFIDSGKHFDWFTTLERLTCVARWWRLNRITKGKKSPRVEVWGRRDELRSSSSPDNPSKRQGGGGTVSRSGNSGVSCRM